MCIERGVIVVALILVGLHNTYKGFDGAPAGGQVVFKPIAGVLEADQDTTYSPLPITANVTNGELQVTLAAPATETDGPVTYLVTEKLAPLTADSNLPPYQITLPAAVPDGAVLELSDRDSAGLVPLPTGDTSGSGVFGAGGTFG